MRIVGGVGRAGAAAAAVLALLAVAGCEVRDTGAGTTGPGTGTGAGSGGRHRSPAGTRNAPGGDDRPGTGDGGGSAKGTAAGTAAGRTTAPAAPPARVLWSRGDSGRSVRELQARLRQIAWLSEAPTGTYGPLTERAVRGFQSKRGLPATGRTDTVTWRRLVAMTHAPGTWELYPMGGQPAGAPDARCLTGRVLCIDKTSRTLRWMIDGRTLSTMAVRFGTQYTPTREGEFQVYWKSRHHVSTIYHTAMPYAMFFSGGQAVHYSSDFAARGYAGGSHGCVNVRDEAAIARLFAQVKVGDKVVVHR
ncbi:L,D-transpeptidase family protein [Streptomyces sp. RCPT1-4]|nr:L,D-transpeptidase family protein [Streptomyces sennicomposti]MBY8868142.1 L,D-transpeptidase family protein [Streptomyces sennicomposti]